MKLSDSSFGGGGGIDDDVFGDPRAWPPGFRFSPTDEELILYYLKRKICRRRLKLNVIKDTDVYKWDPEELPGQALLKTGDRQWYFFTPRDRKYPNGARSNRATRQGYWKATGKDRNISWNSRSVGVKKTLVFYRGRAPSGERTDWVMHEYTMDENELQRCKNVHDYYALYKVFKKSGPGPKNGEQYGAPFREEDWVDDDEVVENNTTKEIAQVCQSGSALVDNHLNRQFVPPVDDFDELFRQIDEAERNPLPNNEFHCAPPQIGAEGETQSDVMGPSFGETRFDEPVSSIPHPNQSAYSNFISTQSAATCQPSCDAPEVTSSLNFSEFDYVGNEEISFLELADLDVPLQPAGGFCNEITKGENLHLAEMNGWQGSDNMINAAENSQFGEMDVWQGSDLFFDATMFFQDMGTGQSSISDPSFDNIGGDMLNQMGYETPTLIHNGNQVSGQLWMQNQRFNVSVPAESNHVAMNPPTSASVCIIHAENSTALGGERQNRDDKENDVDSWFSSAISTYLGTVPTRPAFASENVLINRAFERMSSFGRQRNVAVDSVAATSDGRTVAERKRVGRNEVPLFFSLFGVLCAVVLWILLIGTVLKFFKNVFGRFIS